VLQRRERNVDGPVRRVNFGCRRESERQNQRRLLDGQRLSYAILGPRAAHDGSQLEFIDDRLDAQQVEFVLCFEEAGCLPSTTAANAVSDAFASGRCKPENCFSAVKLPRSRLPARIVERLPDQGDRAHQRARIGRLAKTAQLKRHRLGHIATHDQRRRRPTVEIHQRALPAEHPAARHHVRRRKCRVRATWRRLFRLPPSRGPPSARA